MDQVTAEINFIKVALGSFVGNPDEMDRQKALLPKIPLFTNDLLFQEQLKAYVRLSEDKLERFLEELQKKRTSYKKKN